NDGRADVRHDAESTHRAMFERASRKQAVHAEHRGTLSDMPFEEGSQSGAVKAWNANDRFEPADGKHHQGEEDARFEFRNPEAIAERVGDGAEHGRLKAKG